MAAEEYEVVYSGALDRAAAQAGQRPAPAAPRAPQTMVDRVYAQLRLGPATLPELSAALGATQNAVNGALYQLRKAGRIAMGPVAGRSRYGRRCRSYRVVA